MIGKDSLTRNLTGSQELPLAEVIAEFFTHSLIGPAARTPMPELHPDCD